MMFKHRSTLEWKFLAEGEQSEPWPPDPNNPSGPSEQAAAPRLRRAILFGITMAILLTAGISAAYAHYEAEQGVRAIEQDVRAAAEAEHWVGQYAPQLSADVMVDDHASSYVAWMVSHEQIVQAVHANDGGPDPVLHIRDTWFANGIAAAEMTLAQSAPDGSAAAVYRQTRFYRETADGWLRTKPDPALWGRPLGLETAHVVWRYRRRDEAVVTAIAGQIEAMYVKLQRDYGLVQPSENDKQVIDVQVDHLPKSRTLFSPPGTTIIVPSPSIYLAPRQRTDAEILVQAVALALLNRMWAQAATQHGIEPSWALSKAMSLWELSDMELSLSGWKYEIVQWILGDEPPADDSSAVRLPAHYDELCAAFGMWLMKPVAIGIPLACDSTDRNPEHNKALLGGLRGENLKFFQEVYLHHTIRNTVQWGNRVTLYTVIDYAVTTYGRSRLPALVAALGRYDTWETLVPDVFGVSLDEFDAGWRTYLAQQYGVDGL